MAVLLAFFALRPGKGWLRKRAPHHPLTGPSGPTQKWAEQWDEKDLDSLMTASRASHLSAARHAAGPANLPPSYVTSMADTFIAASRAASHPRASQLAAGAAGHVASNADTFIPFHERAATRQPPSSKTGLHARLQATLPPGVCARVQGIGGRMHNSMLRSIARRPTSTSCIRPVRHWCPTRALTSHPWPCLPRTPQDHPAATLRCLPPGNQHPGTQCVRFYAHHGTVWPSCERHSQRRRRLKCRPNDPPGPAALGV